MSSRKHGSAAEAAAPRQRYVHVLGRAYILIRPFVLWPIVALDVLGYGLRAVVERLRPQAARPDRPVRSILAIRLDHIGDVLLTTPALRMLKARYPEARLSCLVGSWSADVLSGNGAVDEVIVFDAGWFGGRERGLAGLLALGRLALRLGFQRYDMVLDFRGDLRHLLLGRFVGRKLHGYGIRGGGFLLSHELRPDEQAHEAVRYVNLARAVTGDSSSAVGPLSVELTETERRAAAELFASLELDPDRLIVAVCPLSRSPTRWWRPERFAALCRHLSERHRAQILIFGDQASRPFVSQMLAEPLGDVHDLVGRTTLRGFAAALERVDLVVSIESSPIHFASALGKPIVTLFGGTTLPQHWAPHAVPHRIVNHPVACSPCFQMSCPLETVLCMEAIEVRDVIGACDELLGELGAARRELAAKL